LKKHKNIIDFNNVFIIMIFILFIVCSYSIPIYVFNGTYITDDCNRDDINLNFTRHNGSIVVDYNSNLTYCNKYDSYYSEWSVGTCDNLSYNKTYISCNSTKLTILDPEMFSAICQIDNLNYWNCLMIFYSGIEWNVGPLTLTENNIDSGTINSINIIILILILISSV